MWDRSALHRDLLRWPACPKIPELRSTIAASTRRQYLGGNLRLEGTATDRVPVWNCKLVFVLSLRILSEKCSTVLCMVGSYIHIYTGLRMNVSMYALIEMTLALCAFSRRLLAVYVK